MLTPNSKPNKLGAGLRFQTQDTDKRYLALYGRFEENPSALVAVLVV